MFVYPLRRHGYRIDRVGLQMQPPRHGDLRMEWRPDPFDARVIGFARLIDPSNPHNDRLLMPLRVRRVWIKSGLLLVGKEDYFSSKSHKAKHDVHDQSWFCVDKPRDLGVNPHMNPWEVAA